MGFSKEEIIEYYIKQNHNIHETAEYFGKGLRSFQRIISKLGIKKDRKLVYEKQKETLLRTKGVENVFQLNEVKEKSIKTSQEKYGKKYFVQTDDYKSKNLETRKQRYGEDPFQRNKFKETCKKKFGVENYDYVNYTAEQLKLLNDKDYCIDYINSNEIKNALDFTNKSGIKQYAALTLLHKHNLMSMFDYYTSSQEIEIQNYLKSKNIEFVTHYRIENKEIDIFIPSKMIGIEFNGNFWHCEVNRPNKNYHKEKTKIAESNGIFLYHIFEYEWNSRKVQILNQIDNLLGINETKIYARKCFVKMVSKKDKKTFLETNHLQGNDHSLLYYGLYYHDKLVSLMTFSKPHNNLNYEWELSRFCSLAGCNVVGGAGKLLSAFIKDNNPKSIISYSMISHTRGNLYKILGFECINISTPSYVWYKSGDIKSRYQTRVKNLRAKGFQGNSEIDIMHNLGYSRIFDCGNKVWVWNIEDNK